MTEVVCRVVAATLVFNVSYLFQSPLSVTEMKFVFCDSRFLGQAFHYKILASSFSKCTVTLASRDG